MKVIIYVDNSSVPHGFEEANEIVKDYIDSNFETYWEDFINSNGFSAKELHDAIIAEHGETIHMFQERWEEFFNYEFDECMKEFFTVYEINA